MTSLMTRATNRKAVFCISMEQEFRSNGPSQAAVASPEDTCGKPAMLDSVFEAG